MIPDEIKDAWHRGFRDIPFFAQHFLGVTLHEGQIEWLTNSNEPENVLVTGNRWGKSFVSAVKLLHHAIYRPRDLKYDDCGRYRAVAASITQDQANLIFRDIVRLLRRSEGMSEFVEEIHRTPYPVISFTTGATIEARSTQNKGEYLLGNDYDLVIFDEVAFDPDPEYVVEEVIMMRLADRAGRLDLVSTPNGKNWLYRRARDIIEGKRRGYFQTGDTRQNPYLSHDYLDDRVNNFSETRLHQNIMGEFVDSGGELLRTELIDAALLDSPPVLSQLTAPLYISGWDLARKQTATVGITVAVENGHATVVMLERFRNFDWNVVLQKIRTRQEAYPGSLVIDATGLGDVIAEQLSEYRPESIIFTMRTKAELLTNVELFHARRHVHYADWRCPDGPGRVWSFVDELRAARWDDNNRCDALMALALALWPLRQNPKSAIAPRVATI